MYRKLRSIKIPTEVNKNHFISLVRLHILYLVFLTLNTKTLNFIFFPQSVCKFSCLKTGVKEIIQFPEFAIRAQKESTDSISPPLQAVFISLSRMLPRTKECDQKGREVQQLHTRGKLQWRMRKRQQMETTAVTYPLYCLPCSKGYLLPTCWLKR